MLKILKSSYSKKNYSSKVKMRIQKVSYSKIILQYNDNQLVIKLIRVGRKSILLEISFLIN